MNVPDPAAHNEEVARKLAAQDAAGRSNAVPDAAGVKATEDALDALVKQVQPNPEDQTPPAQPTPEDEAAKKAAEEAAAKLKADADAKATAEAAAREVQTKKADEIFKDTPSLPQGASVKSVEAFTTIKLKAAQEVSRLEQELEKARTEIKAAQDAASKPSPESEAREKELQELRQWRAKLDVDYDPKFKDFDKAVQTKQEFIYSLLRESPAVKEEVIDQIKKYGGPEHTNMTKLFEAMKDPALQKMVENAVAEIKVSKFEKDRAIKSAKENVQQWMTERQQATEKEQQARGAAVKTELDGLLGKVDWFKEKSVGDKATAEEKADAKSHNDLRTQLLSELSAVLNDDSPQTKAILLTGVAKLTWLQGVHDRLVKAHEATKAELAQANELLAKVKASSTSRLRESAAPVDGKLPSKPQDIFTTPATDALDKLAAQITEQRRAQGS